MRLSSMIIFGIGALVGSFVTYVYYEKKYENVLIARECETKEILEEETIDISENSRVENPENIVKIEEAKKAEEDRIQKAKEKNEAELRRAVEKERDEILDLYQGLLADHGYLNEYDDLIINLDRVEINPNPRPPYVIPREMLNEDEYTVIQTVYYADGVLADDNEDRIVDWKDLIGSMENLDGFDIPGNDEIYIRNERLHIDVEILRDLECYSNIRRKYTWREE